MTETFDQSNMFGINGTHKHCDSRNGAASSLFPSRRPHLRAGSYDVRSFRRLVRLRFSIHLSIHATYKSRHSLAWCRLGHHDFCFFHQSFLPVSISCVFSSHLTLLTTTVAPSLSFHTPPRSTSLSHHPQSLVYQPLLPGRALMTLILQRSTCDSL